MSEHDFRVFKCVLERRVVQPIEAGENVSVSAREVGIKRVLLRGGTDAGTCQQYQLDHHDRRWTAWQDLNRTPLGGGE